MSSCGQSKVHLWSASLPVTSVPPVLWVLLTRPALTCPVRATRAMWPRVTAPALDHRAVPGRQHLGADPLRKHQGGGQLRKSDRFVDGPRVTGQGKDQPRCRPARSLTVMPGPVLPPLTPGRAPGPGGSLLLWGDMATAHISGAVCPAFL